MSWHLFIQYIPALVAPHWNLFGHHLQCILFMYPMVPSHPLTCLHFLIFKIPIKRILYRSIPTSVSLSLHPHTHFTRHINPFSLYPFIHLTIIPPSIPPTCSFSHHLSSFDPSTVSCILPEHPPDPSFTSQSRAWSPLCMATLVTLPPSFKLPSRSHIPQIRSHPSSCTNSSPFMLMLLPLHTHISFSLHHATNPMQITNHIYPSISFSLYTTPLHAHPFLTHVFHHFIPTTQLCLSGPTTYPVLSCLSPCKHVSPIFYTLMHITIFHLSTPHAIFLTIHPWTHFFHICMAMHGTFLTLVHHYVHCLRSHRPIPYHRSHSQGYPTLHTLHS